MSERDRRIIEAMIGEADDWHIVDPDTGAEIDQDSGIAVTPEQFKSLLAGESAVVGPTRRVVTLADGPFSIQRPQVLGEENAPGMDFKRYTGRVGKIGGSLPTGMGADVLSGFPVEDFEKPRETPTASVPEKVELDLDDKAFAQEPEDIAVQGELEDGISTVPEEVQGCKETMVEVAGHQEPAPVPEIAPANLPEETPVEPEVKSALEAMASSDLDLETGSTVEETQVSEETGDAPIASGDVKGLLTRLIDLVEKVTGWNPVVNLTFPEQQPPVVNVYLPEQAAAVVNLTLPEEKTPEVHIHVPEQPAPVVNLTLPETKVEPPPAVAPNIIVQPAPVTVIQRPMAKLLRRHGEHRLARDGPGGVVTGNVVDEEYEYEDDGNVEETR